MRQRAEGVELESHLGGFGLADWGIRLGTACSLYSYTKSHSRFTDAKGAHVVLCHSLPAVF